MVNEIKIPQISEGVDTATVSEILVSKGDQIEEEQSVISVETDKATAEVPATASGTIKEIKISVGQEVKVGDVVIILEDGENESSKDQKEQTSKDEQDSNNKEETKEENSQDEKNHKEQGSEDQVKGKPTETDNDINDTKDASEEGSYSKEIYASPGVRRLARELGINLQEIQGSGESGRITKKDVKNQQQSDDNKNASTLSQLPDFSKWGMVERKKLNNIKKTTAKNVTASWQSIPHVYQFGQADISSIEDHIEKHQDDIEKAGGKLTITSILSKIVATALHQFPMFNASIDMEKQEMILKKYININIAVATDKGLLVPVIKNADQKSIKDLSVEISEIAQRAREQKLSVEEMEGGNFSISNLGGIGGTNFTPIVYHPQVAILGISQANKKPIYVNGELKPRSILPLSLSYDHRLIDGADGAAFMNWIVNALEDPYEALLS